MLKFCFCFSGAAGAFFVAFDDGTGVDGAGVDGAVAFAFMAVAVAVAVDVVVDVDVDVGVAVGVAVVAFAAFAFVDVVAGGGNIGESVPENAFSRIAFTIASSGLDPF